jgi:hypothetical protein
LPCFSRSSIKEAVHSLPSEGWCLPPALLSLHAWAFLGLRCCVCAMRCFGCKTVSSSNSCHIPHRVNILWLTLEDCSSQWGGGTGVGDEYWSWWEKRSE